LDLTAAAPVRRGRSHFSHATEFVMTLLAYGRKGSASAVVLLTLGLAGTPGRAADLDKGRKIASAKCSMCHGADGKSTLPEAPNLAGQVEPYLRSR